jgi:vacuolar-type H+-ATPase subunit F/Vma7
VEYFFIGDAELLTAFRFIGIDGVSVNTADEALSAFRRCTRGEVAEGAVLLPQESSYKVLILTEEVAAWLGNALVDWQLSGRYPLVVEIPGIMGHIEGRKTLIDAIREAIGIHI